VAQACDCPGDQWHTLPWFQKVWFAAENQGGAAKGQANDVSQSGDIKPGGAANAYKKLQEAGSQANEVHLAWYLMMLRNIFGHAEPVQTLLSDAGGLERGLAFLHDSPVAQPIVHVVQRFRRILAVAETAEGTGGAPPTAPGGSAGDGGSSSVSASALHPTRQLRWTAGTAGASRPSKPAFTAASGSSSTLCRPGPAPIRPAPVLRQALVHRASILLPAQPPLLARMADAGHRHPMGLKRL
jgi:hypothetical protein